MKMYFRFLSCLLLDRYALYIEGALVFLSTGVILHATACAAYNQAIGEETRAGVFSWGSPVLSHLLGENKQLVKWQELQYKPT